VGTNRYAYAGNDPINKSDPNGHCAGACVAIGVGVVIGLKALDAYFTAEEVVETTIGLNDGTITPGQAAVSTVTNIAIGAIVPGAKTAKGLAKHFDGVIGKITGKLNNIAGQLNDTTLRGASKELSGKVTGISRRTGKPYDHVQKVEQAIVGLTTQIGRVNKTLGSSGLSKAQRAALQAQKARASKMLDRAKNRMSGGKKGRKGSDDKSSSGKNKGKGDSDSNNGADTDSGGDSDSIND